LVIEGFFIILIFTNIPDKIFSIEFSLKAFRKFLDLFRTREAHPIYSREYFNNFKVLGWGITAG